MLLAEALQAFFEGHTAMGIATLVQLLKALHQVAIDGENWDSALHMLPYQDPLASDEFGGEEEELETIAAYRKAVKELKIGVKKRKHNNREGGHAGRSTFPPAAPHGSPVRFLGRWLGFESIRFGHQ